MCLCVIPWAWKERHVISRQISGLFQFASLIYNACTDTAILLVAAESSSIWDRKEQLFDKWNRVGFIKRTKVNFLFLKLIKAKAALLVFLVSSVLLCRGVLLGCFAVPVPILSLFTQSWGVSVLRESSVNSYCVQSLYLEHSGEGRDYT